MRRKVEFGVCIGVVGLLRLGLRLMVCAVPLLYESVADGNSVAEFLYLRDSYVPSFPHYPCPLSFPVQCVLRLLSQSAHGYCPPT